MNFFERGRKIAGERERNRENHKQVLEPLRQVCDSASSSDFHVLPRQPLQERIQGVQDHSVGIANLATWLWFALPPSPSRNACAWSQSAQAAQQHRFVAGSSWQWWWSCIWRKLCWHWLCSPLSSTREPAMHHSQRTWNTTKIGQIHEKSSLRRIDWRRRPTHSSSNTYH